MLPTCGRDGCQNQANKSDKLRTQKRWHTAEECQMLSYIDLASLATTSNEMNAIYDCIFTFRM